MRGAASRGPFRTAAWLAFALALLGAGAEPARGLTIEEALAAAVRSNPTVRAAREAARARHQDLPLALSAWLPSIDFDAQVTHEHLGSTGIRRVTPVVTRITDTVVRSPYTGQPEFVQGPDLGLGLPTGRAEEEDHFHLQTPTETTNAVTKSRFPSSETERQTLSLLYRQNLFRNGADTARLRRAGAGVRQSHALAEDAEQTVLLQVAAAYLDSLRAGRIATLRGASFAAFDESVSETEAQFRIGDRTRADVAQARAERDVAAADVAAAEADLEIQRARLEMLIGLPPRNLQPAGEPAGLPLSLDAARAAASEWNPAARAALHALRAAEHGVRAALGDLGPSVDLTGRVTRTINHRGVPSVVAPPVRTDRSVTLRLSVPLYQAGASGARLRQAKLLRSQRRDEWLAARRNAVQQATRAWRNFQAARLRRQALSAAVAASDIALEGIRRQAAIGERTLREVLDAKRNFAARQVSAFQAERDVVFDAYVLLGATGALTARMREIEGTPDLGREAERARWAVMPGLLSAFRTE